MKRQLIALAIMAITALLAPRQSEAVGNADIAGTQRSANAVALVQDR